MSAIQKPTPTTVPNDEAGVVFNQGRVIFAEGDPGENAYIIENGFVEVSVFRHDQKVRLAVLGPGEIFGEMALIDHRPRTATVSALTTVEAMMIDRTQIDRRLADADVITASLLRLTLDRFRRLQQMVHDMPGHGVAATIGAPFGTEESGALTYEVARERLKFERELRNALDHNQFFLEYQPVVAMEDGSLSGFEALIRWTHPEKGRVAPNLFINLAEEAGLIRDIDRWAMRTALTAFEPIYKECQDLGLKPPRIAVNISGIRFTETDMVAELEQVLADVALPGAQVTVEITETALIRNPELALVTLNALKKAGFMIALDDFGTGYSSLSYLQRFPIDIIKVDLSFVQKMQSSETSLQIVRAIIGLAHALNIQVTAEGVEVPVQARMLREMGANYGQGWLFSRALSQDAARAYTLGNSAGLRVR
jgi:EAL domain-containing protein (putative c-di-GMP-specific phosphodiesterase class I)